MGKKDKKFLAICLNWNKADLTVQFVQKLVQYDEIDICIIDNNSRNTERDKLVDFTNKLGGKIIEEKHLDSLKIRCNIYLIIRKENDGYAKGNNSGLALSSKLNYEFSLIANNDIDFISDFKSLLSDIECQTIDFDFIAPIVYSPSNRIQSFDYRIQTYSLLIFKFSLLPIYLKHYQSYTRFLLKRNSKMIEVERLPGCFFFAKTRSFKSIDFFDENTFLYGEENIVAIKAKRHQLRSFLIKGHKVLHLHETTTKLIKNKDDIFIQSTIYTAKTYLHKNKFSIFFLKLAYLIYQHFWIAINKKIKNGNEFKNRHCNDSRNSPFFNC